MLFQNEYRNKYREKQILDKFFRFDFTFENKVELNGNSKNGFIKFLPIFEKIDEKKINNIFKSMKSTSSSKEDLIELLK